MTKRNTFKQKVIEIVTDIIMHQTQPFTGYDLLLKCFETGSMDLSKKAVIQTYVYDFLKSEEAAEIIEFVESVPSEQGDFTKNKYRYRGLKT